MHGDAQYMHGHWFMKLLIMNDSRFKNELIYFLFDSPTIQYRHGNIAIFDV